MDAKRYRRNVRLRERRGIMTALPSDAPFLTFDEAAARLGVVADTLFGWIKSGIVPRPRRMRPRSGHRYPKRPFRRAYVEAVRNALVVRASTPGQTKDMMDEFKKLCWKMAWGCR